MTDPTDNETPEQEEARKKGGSSGKGRVGGGQAGGAAAGTEGLYKFSRGEPITVSPEQKKGIFSDWKHLNLAEAVAAVAEFFSELPARASANLQVNWASLQSKGFAVVSHFIASGQEVAQLLRERTAGAIKRLRTKYGVKVASPRTAAPGVGPSAG